MSSLQGKELTELPLQCVFFCDVVFILLTQLVYYVLAAITHNCPDSLVKKPAYNETKFKLNKLFSFFFYNFCKMLQAK